MQYTIEVIINKPRVRVIELFDSVDNMKKWQEGLVSFEHISGEPGQTGAKSTLLYDTNGRKVEMIETITSRNFPDEFAGTYEINGVYNIISNKFYAVDDTKTRWVIESEFQFSGFMKVIAFFMGGSFRKQTQKMMNDFKNFAENAQ